MEDAASRDLRFQSIEAADAGGFSVLRIEATDAGQADGFERFAIPTGELLKASNTAR